MPNVKSLLKAVAPYAAGAAAGGGAYAAGADVPTSAVSSILASTLASRPTLRGLRGGAPGEAVRDLDRIKFNPENWRVDAANPNKGRTEYFDYHAKAHRPVDVDLDDAGSVAYGRKQLGEAASGERMNTILKDIVLRKGLLGAVVAGSTGAVNAAGILGDIRDRVTSEKGVAGKLDKAVGQLAKNVQDMRELGKSEDIKRLTGSVESVGNLAGTVDRILQNPATPWVTGGAAGLTGAALLYAILRRRKKAEQDA